MLGVYLTTAVNFLAADTPTISNRTHSIWIGLMRNFGKGKKDALLYDGILPQINDLLVDACVNYFCFT